MTEGHTERLEAALAGRYKIERKLGEGGMASVYLAEDLKHKRKVALKILRPELAAVIGAERFLAEIQTTANLQHPHILPLFDSGSADGYLYYVMPFIDGETLRDKLDREKQLGVEESVRIARDVADALDYAHRHGVIHRDIKPGNILLHDGRPVVADFGIALAVSAAGGGRMTETGLSLGTPHYMSPEQASADRDLSARSDVYSLGCVLYEMLGGQPPHTGPSAQSILVHILTEDPKPLTALRHTVPANVAAAVAKSIEKLPADRFESARQLREALEDPAFTYVADQRTPAAGIATPADGYAMPSRPWLRDERSVVTLVLAVTTTVLAVWGWFGGRAPSSERTPVRFTVTPGLDATFGHNGGARDLAISPDGSFVVYNGSNADGTAPRLYVRMLGELEAVALRGADGGMAPVVSPDGAWVAFITLSGQGTLQRVSAIGGAPVRLAQVPGTILGVTWGNNGDIIFAGGAENRALYRVPEVGGEPVTLATPEGELESYVWPSLIEGRQAVLFVITNSGPTLNTYEDGELAALDLRSGEITRLGIQGSSPRYLSTGHLLYAVSDGSVRAVPFDADALTATGAAVPVLEGIQITDSGSADYDVSHDGRLVYSVSSGAGAPAGRSLVWVDREGREELIGAEKLSYVYPRFSPDGRRLALDARTPYDGIRVWDFSGETLTPLALGERLFSPIWTPDGRRIAYWTAEGVFSILANNTGTPEPLLEDALLSDGSSMGNPYFFTSDGATLVFGVRNPETELDLMMVSLGGPEAEIVGRLILPGIQRNAELSPDGAWMAYESDESGRWEVYVRPFPDLQGGNVQVSNEGGLWPLWSRDGRELFYVEGGGSFEATLMSVTAEDRQTGGSFGYTNRHPLMDWPYYQRLRGRSYDVSADGRFVAIAGESVTEGQQMTIVTDWFTELRERMGGS